MPDVIDDFRGKYRWLSNFELCSIEYEGDYYCSTEHAYQAAKFPKGSPQRKAIIESTSPREAKKLGYSSGMRFDWNSIKPDVMLSILRTKFKTPVYKKLLLETGDAELIENNTWMDQYWGICNGVGENHLGKSLMMIREELRKEKPRTKVDLYRAQMLTTQGVDTTIKGKSNSTSPIEAQAFAPTWDMVTKHKSGKMSDLEYTQLYIPILKKAGKSWVWLYNQAQNVPDSPTPILTVKCYCPDTAAFCHTYVLVLFASIVWPKMFEDKTYGYAKLSREVFDYILLEANKYKDSFNTVEKTTD